MSAVGEHAPKRSAMRRLFRRSVWENVATTLIAVGVVMLVQPLSLTLYTCSFVTILTGTVFMIVSKLPD